MFKTLILLLLGIPMAAFLAVMFSLVGLLQGQWLGASLRGRGGEFRRNLAVMLQRNPRIPVLSGSLYMFLIIALVHPVVNLLTSGFDVRTVVAWQTVITLGILFGISAGIISLHPVGRKTVLAIAVIGSLLTWMLLNRGSEIPQVAGFGMYGFVLLVNLFNGIRFLKNNAAKPEVPVTQIDDLRLAATREMARKLLQGSAAIMEQSPSRRVKIYDANLDGYALSVKACLTDSGIAIGILDGYLEENFEPTMPGAETVFPRIMWILIPTEAVDFLKSEKLIGYSETSYRLSPSDLRLSIIGLSPQGPSSGKLVPAVR